MKVPTIQKSNRLGTMGTAQAVDPRLARAEGERISKAGQIVTNVANTQNEFNKRATAAEKSLAKKNAQSAYNIFLADFEKQVADQGTSGKDYRTTYETAYNDFANKYMESNPDYQEESRAELDSQFSRNLGDVQAKGNKKRSKDIIKNTNKVVQGSMEELKRSPDKFAETMVNVTETLVEQVEAGALRPEALDAEIERVTKEGILNTVNGYSFKNKYTEAIAFAKSAEAGGSLGREDQEKLIRQLKSDRAAEQGYRVNNERRAYELSERKRKEDEKVATISAMQAVHSADSPAQLEVLEKQFFKNANEMGITNLGKILTRVKGNYQEIDGASEMDITRQMIKANDVAEYDTIERSVIAKTAAGSMLPETATGLLNKLRNIRNNKTQDPLAKFEDKAAEQKLMQLYNPEFTEKMMNNKQYEMNTRVTWGKYFTLRSEGFTAAQAVNKVLKDIDELSGAVEHMSPITGESLDSQKSIFKHIRRQEALKATGRLTPEQEYNSRQMIIDANQRLKRKEELKNYSEVDKIITDPITPEKNLQLITPYRRSK